MTDNQIALLALFVTGALIVAYKRKQKTHRPKPDDKYRDSGDDWDYGAPEIDDACPVDDSDDSDCDDSDD